VQGEGITERLAAEMALLGLTGPVLVVGDSVAVGALAPVWAASMAAAGWQHRVRVFGGECTAAEIEALAAEARSLGARALVGVGGSTCLDAARATAAAVDLPFVSCPTVASTDASSSHGRNPDLVLVDSSVIARSGSECRSPS
jgi:glycerol dehydrogenase